jgi:hypothetical protein
MNAVRLLLPTVLVIWFLWKARRNILFLLGLPIMMSMYYSIFFQDMRPFWTPGRFTLQTHVMMWLVLAWLVVTFRWSKRGGDQLGLFGVRRMLPEEFAILLLAVLAVAHSLGVFTASGDLREALSAATIWLYLVAGYLLVRGIAVRATREETIEFLGAIVIVNTIAAAMYVVHEGLQIPVYPNPEYFTTTFAGAEITRSMTFAPQYTALALGFILARRHWTPGWLVALAITMMAVLLSYTRTLLIAAVVALVIAIVVRELKNPNAGRLVRRTVTIIGSAVAVVVALLIVRPVQFQYLLSRFAEFTSGTSPGDIRNWATRADRYDQVWHLISKQDAFFGLGYPPAGSNPVGSLITQWLWDSTWIPILYHFGLIGVVLVGAVLVGFALRSLRFTFGVSEDRRYLGMVFVITLAVTAIMTMWGPTFLNPIVTMGLWLPAFIAAEAFRPSLEEAETAREVKGEEARLLPASGGGWA